MLFTMLMSNFLDLGPLTGPRLRQAHQGMRKHRKLPGLELVIIWRAVLF